MVEKVDSVMRFSPGNCTPEFLEKILVGQHEVVSRLEKSVLDSIKTGAGHHCLLVGPRGIGKTHLLAILFNRIDKNQKDRDRVIIAYMKEEEHGVASFLDWVISILKAFERRNEAPNQLQDKLDNLKALSYNQKEAEALRLLHECVGEKQLLLIVENLGEIFKGIGKAGQRSFRDLIQQDPVWTVMASTQNLFADIQKQDGPFYGFFKIQHLQPFNLEQTIELLEKLADSENHKLLKEFFRTPKGRARIRAIHDFTGGNPRLLVIFYQVIDHESIADLADSFLEMADNLTSYYQEQLGKLAAGQRKILNFLCEHRAPATVKEITQSCNFKSHGTASKELGKLINRRVVRCNKQSRESYYELREPLVRIWVEVKENMGYPTRLFADFLATYYSIEELKRKYKNTNILISLHLSHHAEPEAQKLTTDLDYIEKAMLTYNQEKAKEKQADFIRHKKGETPEIQEIFDLIDDLVYYKDYHDAIKLANAALEYEVGGTELLRKSAFAYQRMGDFKNAQKRLSQYLKKNPDNAEVWAEKGVIEIAQKDYESSEKSFQGALEIDRTNVNALIGLGAIYYNTGENAKAIKYLHMASLHENKNAIALTTLGYALEKLGAKKRARKIIDRAQKIDPDTTTIWSDQFAKAEQKRPDEITFESLYSMMRLGVGSIAALLELGKEQELMGNVVAARAIYDRVLELVPADGRALKIIGAFELSQGALPVAIRLLVSAERYLDKDAGLQLLLGEAYELTGRISSARGRFYKATELAPENADVWKKVGSFEIRQREFQRAEQFLVRAIEIHPHDVDSWLLLGQARESLGDITGAQKSYHQATELAPDNPEAWKSIGRIELYQRKTKTAEQYLVRATSLKRDDPESWLLIAKAREDVGDVEGARNSYLKITKLDPQNVDAMLHWGNLESHEGNQEVAIELLEEAKSFEPSSAEQCNMMGESFRMLRLYHEAIEFYQKAIKLDPTNCSSYFNIALARFQSGEFERGIEQMKRAVAVGECQDWDEPLAVCVNDLNVYLLEHAPLDNLSKLITQQQELFDDKSLSKPFTEGMIGALTELLKQHREISLGRLLQLLEGVITELAKQERFEVVCRLFEHGIRFIQTEDKRILLKLALEERSTLEKILKENETEKDIF